MINHSGDFILLASSDSSITSCNHRTVNDKSPAQFTWAQKWSDLLCAAPLSVRVCFDAHVILCLCMCVCVCVCVCVTDQNKIHSNSSANFQVRHDYIS
jgi:hypothetical protein